MSAGTGVPFDTKLRFFAKQIAWLVVMFVILPICCVGLFLGWQYRHDACVIKNPYYVGLAWWLMAVSVFHLVWALVIMVLLCCHVPARYRRFVIWPLHGMSFLSSAFGLWLVLSAELKGTTCEHNELWIYSVVIVVLIGSIALILGSIRACMYCGICMRLGRFMFIEDSPQYQYSYESVGPPLQAFDGDPAVYSAGETF